MQSILEQEKVDLILLDVMLPGLDGFELMRRNRHLNVPIIFITAKDSLYDRITGFELGADDYIIKPFEILELLARINVVLRRNTQTTFGDLSQPLASGSMAKLDVSGQPNVSEVRYSLFNRDPDQIRIVIEMNRDSIIQVNHEFIGDQLIIDLNDTGDFESPIQEPLAGERGKKIVVIDTGHGGSDPGTTSISNKHEKDFNLALSLKVQELLLKEPEIEVLMTRDRDVYPTRTERVQLANTLNADVFVSIHGNSVLESPQANGTETYYYQRSSSKQLANAIHKRLIKAIGLKDRGVKDKSFQVIRETKMAAVLLEIGFLSNISDEKAMISNTVQYKAAQAIVDGIKEYLSIK